MKGWHSAWPAPAKINLFLHVVGRREDGYHLLQTVFRFLGHGDVLRFSPRDDGQILPARPLPGVPPEADLSVRAARLLREASGIGHGVEIEIDKRLPMGGGLGGGSSDAATTLIALNHLWGCGLSVGELEELGLRLGADVPVFVHGRACFAEGVGEKFLDLTLPPAWYLVATPDIAVPTADIFRDPQLRRDAPVLDAAAWRPEMDDNDLEPVACRLFPGVGKHLEQLRRFGRARMSGSGSSCFLEFPREAEARAAYSRMPVGTRGFVARGLDRHPLSELT